MGKIYLGDTLIAESSGGGGGYYADVLVVGGGGGGATGYNPSGGGGGGAEVICCNTTPIEATACVVIGLGGAGGQYQTCNGCDGGTTCFGQYYIAYGGKGALGCCYSATGYNMSGASGTGIDGYCSGYYSGAGGSGATGQGFDIACACGWNSSCTGHQGGAGCCGYGGGGNGGGRFAWDSYCLTSCDGGGLGGCCGSYSSGQNGQKCGGGGGGGYAGTGGNGANGIVRIKYLTDGSCGFSCATGGTVTTSGDYTVHTFTSNGTFTIVS